MKLAQKTETHSIAKQQDLIFHLQFKLILEESYIATKPSKLLVELQLGDLVRPSLSLTWLEVSRLSFVENFLWLHIGDNSPPPLSSRNYLTLKKLPLVGNTGLSLRSTHKICLSEDFRL